LHPGRKDPASRNGFKDATLDPTQLRRWFARGRYNLGLAVPAGHVVVDVDAEEGYRALRAQGFNLPATATQRTPRGGGHYVYRLIDGLTVPQSEGVVASKVDVRSAGKGYIAAAPSVVLGKRYEWLVPLTRDNIADAPAWLLDLAGSADAPARQKRDWSRLRGEKFNVGTRNATMASIAGHLLRRGVDHVVVAVAVHAINETFCEPPLPPREVGAILASIARKELARRGRGRAA